VAGLGGPRGQSGGRGVADLFEAQSVRRDDPDRGITDGGGEHLGGPAGRPAPLADGEQRADQRAHHVVAERVGDHGRDREAVVVPAPVQDAQRADGGRTRPAAAEGGEVVLAQQGPRRLGHGGQIQPPERPQRLVPAQRIGPGRVVADPVGVAAPQRGEPRVEPVGRRARRVRADIGGEHGGQPGQDAVARGGGAGLTACGGGAGLTACGAGAGLTACGAGAGLTACGAGAGLTACGGGPGGRGHVGVDDLPTGVHSGVRASGDGQARRAGQPQYPAERVRHDLLDRAPAGLSGPPGKS
jgi:hypothetical protein